MKAYKKRRVRDGCAAFEMNEMSGLPGSFGMPGPSGLPGLSELPGLPGSAAVLQLTRRSPGLEEEVEEASAAGIVTAEGILGFPVSAVLILAEGILPFFSVSVRAFLLIL